MIINSKMNKKKKNIYCMEHKKSKNFHEQKFKNTID